MPPHSDPLSPTPQHRDAPGGWLPLQDSDPAAWPLPPLLLGLLHAELCGLTRTLCAALKLPDPDGLGERLLGQPGGVPSLHAAHLRELSAPLPPAVRAAFYTALGVAPPLEVKHAAGELPQLTALRHPALRWKPALDTPDTPSSSASRARVRAQALPRELSRELPRELARALRRLGSGSAAPLGAALSAGWLSAASRHWLGQPGDARPGEGLPLDLLCALNGPESATHALYTTARQQALTTLGGPRRTVYRALLTETRAQHAAWHMHREAQDTARRDALYACLRLARMLTQDGWLDGPAQARFLTPAELSDAADGLLDPAGLRALAALRREQAAPVPSPLSAAAQAPPLLSGTPLAPGVRDGLVAHWVPGQPVPEASVLLAPHLHARQWPQVRRACALLLGPATPYARAAVLAREDGQAAVSLPQFPDWQDGDRVRVDGHRGTVTLLRRAGEPDPTPPRPPVPELDIMF